MECSDESSESMVVRFGNETPNRILISGTRKANRIMSNDQILRIEKHQGVVRIEAEGVGSMMVAVGGGEKKLRDLTRA